MLHSNTSKVTTLKQNQQNSSLLSKKDPPKQQKQKTPTNQKANAVVQSSERLTEAKNMTTAIIQVKYMWKFKHATFKLRQKWRGAMIFISESKSLGIITKC